MWSKESRHARGYGSAWDKIRKTVLHRDCGLCQPCSKQGKLTKATEVDHIIDKAQNGTDEDSNLQSICKQCHIEKTLKAQGKTLKPQIGQDGWPV